MTDRERENAIFARAQRAKDLALDGWIRLTPVQGSAHFRKGDEYLDVNGESTSAPVAPEPSLLDKAIAKVRGMSSDDLQAFVEPMKRRGRPPKVAKEETPESDELS